MVTKLLELKRFRQSSGVSIEEISEIAGVTERGVLDFESGKLSPSDERFVKIVNAYSCSVDIDIDELIKEFKIPGRFSIRNILRNSIITRPSACVICISLLLTVLFDKAISVLEQKKSYAELKIS